MLKLAIAGVRHGHIFSLYRLVKESPRAEVVGAWEEDEQAKQDAVKHFGVEFTYDTYQAMLADPNVDAVAIGNYYGARGRMVIDALNAGKHVIADKPLCTSLEELDEIEKIAKERGLAVGLQLDMRYHKNVLSARKIIKDGLIGEVHNIQFGGQHPLNYGVRPSWYFEKGKHCGVINDIAVHGVDLIPFLTGLEVSKTVGARCWNAYASQEPDFKDCGQFMLALSNGAGVIADISYAAPNSIGFELPYYWEFHIWGSKGMLSFSANTNGAVLYQDGFSEAQTFEGIEPENSYLDDFINEIEGKECVSLCSDVTYRSSRATLSIQKKADEYC